jgi:hypothetical protein
MSDSKCLSKERRFPPPLFFCVRRPVCRNNSMACFNRGRNGAPCSMPSINRNLIILIVQSQDENAKENGDEDQYRGHNSFS